jgi:hypothetical protein
MDIIARMEHMIASERNPRKREEMRKVLASTINKLKENVK